MTGKKKRHDSQVMPGVLSQHAALFAVFLLSYFRFLLGICDGSDSKRLFSDAISTPCPVHCFLPLPLYIFIYSFPVHCFSLIFYISLYIRFPCMANSLMLYVIVFMYIYIYLYIYIYIYIYTYIYIYMLYIYMYTYVYIYIYVLESSRALRARLIL